ncbi:hypothetical protein F0562_002917 [Nyssa sinensis]|uniref:Secreted protein n=1 Tax=Nyssa sinensis TaxID=561372 RepID=A0A5J5BUP0_9ASTE|nr:hypothetical protein F0562_002917 [Nyssa sinensis]
MAYHQYSSFVFPLLLITLASTLVGEARHLVEVTLPELPMLPHIPTFPRKRVNWVASVEFRGFRCIICVNFVVES